MYKGSIGLKTRLLSFLLALVMVVSILPISAFAEMLDDADTGTTEIIALDDAADGNAATDDAAATDTVADTAAATDGQSSDDQSTSSPLATTVALSLSATEITVGDEVTITAIVTDENDSSAGIAGAVRFCYIAEDGIGDGDGYTTLAAVGCTDGELSVTTSDLPVGEHQIVAAFYPDDDNLYIAAYPENCTPVILTVSTDSASSSSSATTSAQVNEDYRWEIFTWGTFTSTSGEEDGVCYFDFVGTDLPIQIELLNQDWNMVSLGSSDALSWSSDNVTLDYVGNSNGSLMAMPSGNGTGTLTYTFDDGTVAVAQLTFTEYESYDETNYLWSASWCPIGATTGWLEGRYGFSTADDPFVVNLSQYQAFAYLSVSKPVYDGSEIDFDTDLQSYSVEGDVGVTLSIENGYLKVALQDETATGTVAVTCVFADGTSSVAYIVFVGEVVGSTTTGKASQTNLPESNWDQFDGIAVGDEWGVSFTGGDGEGSYILSSNNPSVLESVMNVDGSFSVIARSSGEVTLSLFKEGDDTYDQSETISYTLTVSEARPTGTETVEIQENVTVTFDYDTGTITKINLSGADYYDVVIPSKINGVTVEEIGAYALYNNYSAFSLTIPDTVTSIGTYAFHMCINLTNVTFEGGSISIDDLAFAMCDRIAELKFEGDSITIGTKAFFGCGTYYSGTFSSVDISATNVSIGEYAFYQCTGLYDVEISAETMTIGAYAFYQCEELQNIMLFGGLETIETYTFAKCYAIEKIQIPTSVTLIKENAFYGRGAFDIYYEGTQAQWNAITIESEGNDGVGTSTKHYNSVLVPKQDTTVALSLSEDYIASNKSVTITATVTDESGSSTGISGTVWFMYMEDGEYTTLTVATCKNGVATATISGLDAGEYEIVAQFFVDGTVEELYRNADAEDCVPVTLTVGTAIPSVKVTTQNLNAVYNGTGTIVVSVYDGNTAVSSNVTLYAYGIEIGSGTTSGGKASIPVTFDTVGYYPIIVVVTPSSNNYGSVTTLYGITVTQASQSALSTTNWTNNSDLTSLEYGETYKPSFSGGESTGDYVLTSSNESVLVVNDDGSVTAVGKGSTTLKLYKAGDDNYNDSATISKSVTVSATALTSVSFPEDVPEVSYTGSTTVTVELDATGIEGEEDLRVIATGKYVVNDEYEPIFTATSVKIYKSDGTTTNSNYTLPSGFSASSISGEIAIVKADPIISVSATSTSVTYGNTFAVKATVKGATGSTTGMNGTVTFYKVLYDDDGSICGYEELKDYAAEESSYTCTNGAATGTFYYSVGVIDVVATFTPNETTGVNYNAVGLSELDYTPVTITINKASQTALPTTNWTQFTGLEYGEAVVADFTGGAFFDVIVTDTEDEYDADSTSRAFFEIVATGTADENDDEWDLRSNLSYVLTSSNEDVLKVEVDETTGKTTVTAVGVGSTTLSLYRSSSDYYNQSATITKNITVTAKSITSDALSVPADAEVSYTGSTTVYVTLDVDDTCLVEEDDEIVAIATGTYAENDDGEIIFTATSVKLYDANGTTVSTKYTLASGFAASSVSGEIAIVKADPTISLTVSETEVNYGTSVTMKVTVKGTTNSTSGMAGMVYLVTTSEDDTDNWIFDSNGDEIYYDEMIMASAVTSGSYTYTSSYISVGEYENIIAVFVPNDSVAVNYNTVATETEDAPSLTVNKVTPSVTVTTKNLNAVYGGTGTFVVSTSNVKTSLFAFVTLTDENGNVLAEGYTKNGLIALTTAFTQVGSYTVTATVTPVYYVGGEPYLINDNYYSTTETYTITVGKGTQSALPTANWTLNDQFTGLTYGDSVTPFFYGGESEGEYVLESTNESVLAVGEDVNGNITVTATGVGSATLKLYKAGDDNYNASATISKAVTVSATALKSVSFPSGTPEVSYTGSTTVMVELDATGIAGEEDLCVIATGKYEENVAGEVIFTATSAKIYKADGTTLNSNYTWPSDVVIGDMSGEITIVKATPTVTMTTTKTTATYGTSITLKATVKGANNVTSGMGGVVYFYNGTAFDLDSYNDTDNLLADDANYLGSVPCSNGSASLAWSTGTAGMAYSNITAYYVPTSGTVAVNYNSASGALGSVITISKTTPTTLKTVLYDTTIEYGDVIDLGDFVYTTGGSDTGATTYEILNSAIAYFVEEEVVDTETGDTETETTVVANSLGSTQIWASKAEDSSYYASTSANASFSVVAKPLYSVTLDDYAEVQYVSGTTATVELDATYLDFDDKEQTLSGTTLIATGKITYVESTTDDEGNAVAGYYTFTASSVAITNADGTTSKNYSLPSGFKASTDIKDVPVTLLAVDTTVSVTTTKTSATYGTTITLKAITKSATGTTSGVNGTVTFFNDVNDDDAYTDNVDLLIGTATSTNGSASLVLKTADDNCLDVGTYSNIKASYEPSDSLTDNYNEATSEAGVAIEITQTSASALKLTLAETGANKLTYGEVVTPESVATVSGGNTTATGNNLVYTYTSSNEAVVKVDDDGNLVAVGVGTAKISVTQAAYGNYKAVTSGTISVTVSAKALTSVALTADDADYLAVATYVTDTTATVELYVEGFEEGDTTKVIATGKLSYTEPVMDDKGTETDDDDTVAVAGYYSFTGTSVKITEADGLTVNKNYSLPSNFKVTDIVNEEVVLAAATPTVAITTTKTSATYGTAITLKATIKGVTGSTSGLNGTVYFVDQDVFDSEAVFGTRTATASDFVTGDVWNEGVIGSAPAKNGSASLVLTTTTVKEYFNVGSYSSVTAVFVPDTDIADNYNSAYSDTCSVITISKATSPTLKSVLSNGNKVSYGDIIPLDDFVGFSGGNETGDVSYEIVNTAVAEIAEIENVQTTLTANALGTTQVWAIQEADNNYNGSSSATVSFSVIAKVLASVTFPTVEAGKTAEATYLTASTATLELDATYLQYGDTDLADAIALTDADDVCIIATGTYKEDNDGNPETYLFTATSVKIYKADGTTINSNYSLPSGFKASDISGTVTVANADPTVTITTTKTSATYGTAITLKATIKGASGSTSGMAGTVYFVDTKVYTGGLTSAALEVATAGIVGSKTTTNGSASLALTTTTVKEYFNEGTYDSIVAVYIPDETHATASHYNAATSTACSTITITQAKPTTAKLVLSDKSYEYGETIALAEIATVTSYGNTDLSGVSYTSSNEAVVKVEDSNLVAVGVGTAKISVTVPADDNYLASTSNTVTVTVTAQKLYTENISFYSEDDEPATAVYVSSTQAVASLYVTGMEDGDTAKVIATGKYVYNTATGDYTFTASSVKVTEEDGVTTCKNYTLSGITASKVTGIIDSIDPATPTVTVTTSKSSATYGTAVTLKATVKGATGATSGLTGTVTFYTVDENNNYTKLSTVKCTNGAASLSIKTLDVIEDGYTIAADFTPSVAAYYETVAKDACTTASLTITQAKASTLKLALSTTKLAYASETALADIATITGGNATATGANLVYTYTSSNEAIVKVDENNNLVAVGVGSAKITVTQAAYGNYAAVTSSAVTVTVSAKVLDSVVFPDLSGSKDSIYADNDYADAANGGNGVVDAVYVTSTTARVDLDVAGFITDDNVERVDDIRIIALGKYVYNSTDGTYTFTATSVKVYEADGITVSKSYSLPSGFKASSVTGVVEIVAADPSIVVTATKYTATYGTSITLKATVKGATGATSGLTGTVTYYLVNADASYTKFATVKCTNGSASLATKLLPEDENEIIAVFTPTVATSYNTTDYADCTAIMVEIT